MPEYRVKELAALEGVESKTIRMWITKGVYGSAVRRTPGGHFRIFVEHANDANATRDASTSKADRDRRA